MWTVCWGSLSFRLFRLGGNCQYFLIKKNLHEQLPLSIFRTDCESSPVVWSQQTPRPSSLLPPCGHGHRSRTSRRKSDRTQTAWSQWAVARLWQCACPPTRRALTCSGSLPRTIMTSASGYSLSGRTLPPLQSACTCRSPVMKMRTKKVSVGWAVSVWYCDASDTNTLLRGSSDGATCGGNGFKKMSSFCWNGWIYSLWCCVLAWALLPYKTDVWAVLLVSSLPIKQYKLMKSTLLNFAFYYGYHIPHTLLHTTLSRWWWLIFYFYPRSSCLE